jgi:hypothetical protein
MPGKCDEGIAKGSRLGEMEGKRTDGEFLLFSVVVFAA